MEKPVDEPAQTEGVDVVGGAWRVGENCENFVKNVKGAKNG